MSDQVQQDHNTTEGWHLPVLLEETISCWVREGARYVVDGTVGGGGHSEAALSRFPDLQLLGLDRDVDALAEAGRKLARFGDRARLHQGSYAELDKHLAEVGWPSQVDGILLDLGVSSYQLDTAGRGFSFRMDGPLDMRFAQEGEDTQTAAELVNYVEEGELARLFRDWGEERHAKRAARAIVRAREKEPFETTTQLRLCLESVLGSHAPKGRVHPATRCFQALRIAVNQEFSHIDKFLANFPSWLATEGRIAIISFHSLEDRRVKQRLRALATGTDDPNVPLMDRDEPTFSLLTRKPITGQEQEIAENPRARSALLRAAQKREMGI
ncbi:MAG: 16S rRNA (cytosine(1402)-N(4))-methyltransferase RsmH [Myxococcales bacterium]|nr:16S rRNA (cytosine(1402)-N(4))-methyltransferase RsmH [Myxococcales bacterium]MCB9644551.1 16S rRNA (cytosine(1402)-N(4))-methyltransferase RsmH [Myxococcales bacterium]